MISDERLSELEQVEGLADLVAEVRRLREATRPTLLTCGICNREHIGPGCPGVSLARSCIILQTQNRIATAIEEKVGPVLGPTLAQMIRELPEE